MLECVRINGKGCRGHSHEIKKTDGFLHFPERADLAVSWGKTIHELSEMFKKTR